MTTRPPDRDEQIEASLSALADILPVPKMDDALVARIVSSLAAKRQHGSYRLPLVWLFLSLVAACAMAGALLALAGAAGLPLRPLAQALIAAAEVVSSLPGNLPLSLPLLLAGAALADTVLILGLIRRHRRHTPWPSV